MTTPLYIDGLLREARDAYGSANAMLLGDLVERLSACLRDVAESWQLSVARIACLEAELTMLRDEQQRRGSELAFLRAKVFGATSERSATKGSFTESATTTAEPFDDEAPTDNSDGTSSDGTSSDGTSSDGTSSDAASEKPERQKRRPPTKEARTKARRDMRAKPSKSQKMALADSAERQEVDVPLPLDLDLMCPACRQKASDRGVAETAREIDVKPSQLVETTYHLHEARCFCGSLRFTMPSPVRGVPQTIFSPAFIAQLIVDKYVLHLPGYRQAKRLASQGLNIDYRRINKLILGAWQVVKPLVERVRELNRQEFNQSVDESPIRVVIDGQKQLRYLWCLVSSRAVSFVVTKLRNKDEARAIVGDGKGTLTSDRLAIYRDLIEGKAEVGCMAHCRRYFFYALGSAEAEALAVIAKIKELYTVEDEAKGLDASARQQLRQEKSAAIMTELKALVQGFNPPPRSALGRAVNYTLTHWKALSYFLGDGAVAIDNNRTESELRDPKIGQKNYLFAQCEDGVDALAGYYTLTRTIQMYEHDPLAYFTDVLSKLNSGWPQNKLDELLPWNWRPPETKPTAEPLKRTEMPDASNVRELPRVRARMARLHAEYSAAASQ